MELPPTSPLSLPLAFTGLWGWSTLGSWCSLVAPGPGRDGIAPLPRLVALGLSPPS